MVFRGMLTGTVVFFKVDVVFRYEFFHQLLLRTIGKIW
jgi:hypothetical protein